MNRYLVVFGFNNHILTKVRYFKLYRNAKFFFNSLDEEYRSAVCYKLTYDKDNYSYHRTVKLYKHDRGDNTAFLRNYVHRYTDIQPTQEQQ